MREVPFAGPDHFGGNFERRRARLIQVLDLDPFLIRDGLVRADEMKVAVQLRAPLRD